MARRAYGELRHRINVWAALILLCLALGTQAARAESPMRILAFGDSLTAGYGLSQQDSFPARLEAALRKAGVDARVNNAGVSGDTTSAALRRIEWLMRDPWDLVIVELGANDGVRGVDPSLTRDNLERIVERARQSGARVLLAGMLAPPNLGRDYGKEFNAVFPEIAERHGVSYYRFFLEGVAGDPSLNLADGLHPNAKGVAIIVDRMLPIVLKALGKDPR